MRPEAQPASELDFGRIVYEKAPPRATITLNHPERLNAFDFQMLRELARACEDASWDDEIRVVVLTGAGDEAEGLRAIRAGATGYLARSVEPDVLPRVLRGALEGEAAISRRLAGELVESYRRAPRGGAGLRPVRSTLTDREWEVLDLVAAGAGTDEIARTLVLSTETVRSHLKNLYRKLGVRSRDEAADAARRLRDLVV